MNYPAAKHRRFGLYWRWMRERLLQSKCGNKTKYLVNVEQQPFLDHSVVEQHSKLVRGMSVDRTLKLGPLDRPRANHWHFHWRYEEVHLYCKAQGKELDSYCLIPRSSKELQEKSLIEIGIKRYMISSCSSYWMISVACKCTLMLGGTVLLKEFMIARWTLA